MQAEIISNGDELICGKILDTNSQWLSIELDDLGIEPLYHTTIGDDLDVMVGVLKIAMQRSDLIIWTGGLGPTADDLTRQAVAKAAGVPLEQDAESLRLIQEMYQRRGAVMPKSNEIQAFQPRSAKAIFNPHGTAPGIDFAPPNVRCQRILVYPGVPAEMKEMWNLSGRQTVQQLAFAMSGSQNRVIRFRSIHCFGLGESAVESMLPGIIERKRIPKVGITATQGTITLRIVAEGTSEPDCLAKMKPTADWIYQTLGQYVFGEDADTLQSVVLRKLQDAKKTVAVVEAGTRGLLAECLSKVPLENVFLGGVVLPPRQPVHSEEMVKIGRRFFDPDYYLLIGNYPQGEPDRNRKDEACVAVIDNRETNAHSSILSSKRYPFVGHPNVIDDLYIKRVLDLFRLTVE